jgi:tripartite ATP-independent transporter DctM subunit
MTDPQIAIVMLGIMLIIIMLGFPIAFSLLALGLFFGFYAMEFRIFDLMVEKTSEVMTNDVLVALPLFLFMGYMVERANILDRLFRSIQVAARQVPASIAVAALVTCALFATATGIVGAVVTLMGVLAYPAMLRANYDPRLSAGVICAGGTLGILIPPSVMLILYGATVGESVVRLYAAALLPGFLLAGMYVIYVVGRAIINPSLAPKLPEEETRQPFGQVLLLLITSFFPLAVLILAVLGAIMFGLATPSEAAAVGALGAIVLAAGYRALTWDRLREAVYLTGRSSAMVCFLFIGSGTFAAVFAYLNGHALIQEVVRALNLSPIMFLILAQFIIFLLGWPLEWTEIIVIFVPIFLPLLRHFDIDPLMFGILIALNLQTSFLTPPVAMSAIYLKGVAPRWVTLSQIQSGCLPFLWIVLVSMAIIYIFPQIALWLPSALYG